MMSIIIYYCIVYNPNFFLRNKEQAEKMKKMHAMMNQTTKNLDQLPHFNQKMIATVCKQAVKKMYNNSTSISFF